MSFECRRCGEYLGWYSEHDPGECDRLVALERARARLLDALLDDDDPDSWAFWALVVGSLERAEASG